MFDPETPFHENYKSFKELMREKRGLKEEQDKLYYEFTEYARKRVEISNDPKAIEWIDMEDVIGQIQDKPTLTQWLNQKAKEEKEKEEISEITEDLEKLLLDQDDKNNDEEYNFSKSYEDDPDESKKDKGSGAQAYYDDDYFKKINEKLRKESRVGSFSAVDYEDLARVERQIKKFVGLKGVKKATKDLISFAQVQQMKRERQLTSDILNFNTAFMGEPGTGKTTMARQYGEIFKALGLLKKGHVVEASRADLIGGYVGHTEIMTQEVFYDALDGVLFIDEAHNLYDPAQYYDFGHECLSTLIKLMEDFRERVIVIFAGYEDQLERTIFKFEGMKSRIPYRTTFEAFKPEEMVEIYSLIAQEKSYQITDEAKTALLQFLNSQNRKSNKIWNGREIRNFFEKSLVEQAKRLSKLRDLTDSQLMTIEAQDLGLPDQSAARKVIAIDDYKE